MKTGLIKVSFDNRRYSYVTFINGDPDWILEESKMVIERGVHTRGLRLRLMLQSTDVESHAEMTDKSRYFKKLMDDIADTMRTTIRDTLPDGKDVA
jgi:hypothetical protein